MRIVVLVLVIAGCRIGFDEVAPPDAAAEVRDDDGPAIRCIPGQLCIIDCAQAASCDVDCNGAAQCIVDCSNAPCTVRGCDETCVVDCGGALPATPVGGRATCP